MMRESSRSLPLRTHGLGPIGAVCLALATASGLAGQTPGGAVPQSERRPYAAIEVGGSGTKYVALRASAAGKTIAVELLGRKDVQTSAGLLKDGKLIPARINDTAREVALIYYDRLRGDLKIPGNRIRVVLSSALFDVPNIEELEAAIRSTLTNPSGHAIALPPGVAPMTADDVVIDKVTVAEELAFLIRGIGKGDRGRSVLVDIGSGNVKCGYFIEEGPSVLPRFHVLVSGPSGTKRLAGEVKQAVAGKPAGQFLDALEVAARRDVLAPLEDCAEANAGLLNRETYYLLGGCVWALTTLTHPEDVGKADELVAITPGDIDRFLQIVKRPTVDGKLRHPDIDLSALAPEVRPKAEAEVRRVFEVFTPEQLAAGALILKNVAVALDLSDPRKSIRTIRDSQFTWSTAFLTTIAERELLHP